MSEMKNLEKPEVDTTTPTPIPILDKGATGVHCGEKIEWTGPSNHCAQFDPEELKQLIDEWVHYKNGKIPVDTPVTICANAHHGDYSYKVGECGSDLFGDRNSHSTGPMLRVGQS